MTNGQELVSLHVGADVVFVNVLLNQIGVPIPALPTLILAGAVAGAGLLPLTSVFASAVAACLIANCVWFLAGRQYGGHVMGLLCRVSLTPDVCVSHAHSRFERWGSNALIVGKFFPGLAIVAPPLAGATRMPAVRFVLATLAGGCLWTGLGLGAGVFLRPEIEAFAPQVGSSVLCSWACWLLRGVQMVGTAPLLQYASDGADQCG